MQKKALPDVPLCAQAGGIFVPGRVGIDRRLHRPVRAGGQEAEDLFQEVRADAGVSPAGQEERGEQSVHRRSRPVRGRLASTEQGEAPEGFRGELNAQREADRVTVNQFAPPGVLINAELQILQFRGPTGAYLEPPTGKASFDVLKMAREGLMLPLRAAINQAKKENKTARRENVRVEAERQDRTVNLEVIPLKNLRERCFLILFEDAEDGRAPSRTCRRREPPARRGEAHGPRGAEGSRAASPS